MTDCVTFASLNGNACSGHGTCVAGSCVCDEGWRALPDVYAGTSVCINETVVIVLYAGTAVSFASIVVSYAWAFERERARKSPLSSLRRAKLGLALSTLITASLFCVFCIMRASSVMTRAVARDNALSAIYGVACIAHFLSLMLAAAVFIRVNFDIHMQQWTLPPGILLCCALLFVRRLRLTRARLAIDCVGIVIVVCSEATLIPTAALYQSNAFTQDGYFLFFMIPYVGVAIFHIAALWLLVFLFRSILREMDDVISHATKGSASPVVQVRLRFGSFYHGAAGVIVWSGIVFQLFCGCWRDMQAYASYTIPLIIGGLPLCVSCAVARAHPSHTCV